MTQIPKSTWHARRWPWVLMVGLAAAGLVLLMASSWPQHAFSSNSLHFESDIPLPRVGLLSALDYMSLRDGHLMVSSISSGDLYDIELRPPGTSGAPTVRTRAGRGAAHGIASSTEGIGFLSRGGRNVVEMFDAKTLGHIRDIKVGTDPDAVIADPDRDLIYVASKSAQTGTFIDAKRGAPLAVVSLPGQPEFAALDATAGVIFQNLHDSNSVAVIDLSSRKLKATWVLPDCEGPTGLTIDPELRLLFVVCSANDKLLTFDIETQLPVSSVDIGLLSDSVAFDPALKRLYVASGSGQLSVISRGPDLLYTRKETLRTRVGGHTVVVDPTTHRVYLAGGGLLVAPRISVFSAR